MLYSMMEELPLSISSVLFIGSWCFAIIEYIFCQSMVISFLKLGIPVRKEVFDIDAEKLENLIQSASFNANEGKFKVKEKSVFFISRLSIINIFRLNTPFPIKGEIKIIGNELTATAKFPLGTSLFIIFWLLGWSWGGLNQIIDGNYLAGLLLSFVGWGFAFIMLFVSYKVEIYRWRLMIYELLNKENEYNRVDGSTSCR